MAIFSTQTPLQRSWNDLRRREMRFNQRNVVVTLSPVERTLDRFLPEQLQATLEAAFGKAFELVFTKGDPVLNVLSGAQKRLHSAQPALAAARRAPTRRNLNVLSRRAARSKALNLAVSGVEGVSLGLLGVGIPDIPLFLSVALKAVYEIAANYGFSCNSDREKCLLLLLIQTALSRGQDLCDGGRALDAMLAAPETIPSDLSAQMKTTAAALSNELLCWKFLQGAPVVGAAGGISDLTCLRRITDYAGLKYQRRFLLTLGKEL